MTGDHDALVRHLVSVGAEPERAQAAAARVSPLTGQILAETAVQHAPAAVRQAQAEAERLLDQRTALAWLKSEGLPACVFEYRFWAGRKYAFDMAWVTPMIALEKEGEVHRIRSRFRSDLEKYAEAQLRGWIVLRQRPSFLYSAITADWLHRALRRGR